MVGKGFGFDGGYFGLCDEFCNWIDVKPDTLVPQKFRFNQSCSTPAERIANNLSATWCEIFNELLDYLRYEFCWVSMVAVSKSISFNSSNITKRPLLFWL